MSRNSLLKQKGLSPSQKNINNTYVDSNKDNDLAKQLSKTEAATQAILQELALYTNVENMDNLKDKEEGLNPIQQLLGLKKNQGVFSSALELINRPAEMLQGALVSVANPTKGDTLISNVWNAMRGNKEFQFKDLGISLGDNPFVNAIGSMSFEVLIDPFNFYNVSKNLVTNSKKAFSSVAKKSEMFFSKTKEGQQFFKQVERLFGDIGTSFHKTFNTWKSPDMKIVSNSISNISAANARTSQSVAYQLSVADKALQVLTTNTIRSLSDIRDVEKIGQINNTLGIEPGFTISKELGDFVKRDLDIDSGEYKDAYNQLSAGARDDLGNISTLLSTHTTRLIESEFMSGGNVGEFFNKITSPKSKPVTSVLNNTGDKIISVGEGAIIEHSVKTLVEFKSTQTYRLVVDRIAAALGNEVRVVDRVAKVVGEININDFLIIEEGVGRLLLDNTGQVILDADGVPTFTASSQGYQMWINDKGKTLLKNNLKDIQNTYLAQQIAKSPKDKGAILLTELINTGEMTFNPASAGSVEKLLEPIRTFYKLTTGYEMNYVSQITPTGAVNVKLVADDRYGLGFESQSLNNKALDSVKASLVKEINVYYNIISKAVELNKNVVSASKLVQENEKAVNVLLQQPEIMTLALSLLKQLNNTTKQSWKNVAEIESFIKFVNQGGEMSIADVLGAPQADGIMLLNTALSKIKFGDVPLVGLDNASIVHWDKMIKGDTMSSVVMDVDYTKWSLKETQNFIAYLKDRGIINIDTLKTMNIVNWDDFNNLKNLRLGFEIGLIPTSLSIKVSPLTKAMDTSNAYINLAQWVDIGSFGLEDIDVNWFQKRVVDIQKSILNGELISTENKNDLYEYFSVRDTQSTLLNTLILHGIPGVAEVAQNYSNAVDGLLQAQTLYNKQVSKVVSLNLEAKYNNAAGDLEIHHNSKEIFESAYLDIESNGLFNFIESSTNKLKKIEDYIKTTRETFHKNSNIQKLKENILSLESDKVLKKALGSFKDTHKNRAYTTTAIIPLLDPKKTKITGLIKEGKIWKFYDKKVVDGVIPLTKKQVGEIRNSYLGDLYSQYIQEAISEANLEMYETNIGLVYALNVDEIGSAGALKKSLTIKEIDKLKSTNFAKATNGVIIEIQQSNIEFAMLRRENKITPLYKELKDIELTLKEMPSFKEDLDKNFEKKYEELKSNLVKKEEEIEKVEKEIEKAEKDFSKKDHRYVLKQQKEELGYLTKEYNDLQKEHIALKLETKKVSEQRNKFKKNEYDPAKKELKELQTSLSKETNRKNGKDLKLINSLTKKVSLRIPKFELLQQTLNDFDEFLADKKALLEASYKKYTSVLDKREVLKKSFDNTKDIEKASEIVSLEKKRASLVTQKSVIKKDINGLATQYKNSKSELQNIEKYNTDREKEISLELKEDNSKNLNLLKDDAYLKNTGWDVIKRSVEEREKVLIGYRENMKLQGSLEQLEAKFPGSSSTFFNPLSNASPQFLVEEYLNPLRSRIGFAMDLFAPKSKKNLAAHKEQISKLPDALESEIISIVNYTQTIHVSFQRMLKQMYGADVPLNNIIGYLKHSLDTDSLLISSIRDWSDGKANGMLDALFGNNPAVLWNARKYQNEADAINKSFGGDLLFNTNPVLAMALSLQINQKALTKLGAINSMIDNNLIKVVTTDAHSFTPQAREKLRKDLLKRKDDLESMPKRTSIIEDDLYKVNESITTLKKLDALQIEKYNISMVKNNAQAINKFNEDSEDIFKTIKELRKKKKEISKELSRIYSLKDKDFDSVKMLKNKVENDIAKVNDKIDAEKLKIKELERIRDLTKKTPEELAAINKKLDELTFEISKVMDKVLKIQAGMTRSIDDFISQIDGVKANKNEYTLLDSNSAGLLKKSLEEIFSGVSNPFTDGATNSTSWGESLKNLVDQLEKPNHQGVIHRGVFEMIKNLGGVSGKEKVGTLLDFLNTTFVPFWKKLALLNPGFLARNWVTNMTNLYLFGLSPQKISVIIGQEYTSLTKFHKGLEQLDQFIGTGIWRTAEEQAELMNKLFFEPSKELRKEYFRSKNIFSDPDNVLDIEVVAKARQAKIPNSQHGTNIYKELFNTIDKSDWDDQIGESFKGYFEMLEKGVIGNNQFNKSQTDWLRDMIETSKGRGANFKYSPKGVGASISSSFNKVSKFTFDFAKQSDDIVKIAIYKYLDTLDPLKSPEEYAKMIDLGFVKQKRNSAGDLVNDTYTIQGPTGAYKTFNKLDGEKAAKFMAFDYNNLSYRENTYLKAIFPFYTYARKSVESHTRAFFKDSRRYTRLHSLFNGLRRGFVDEDEEYDNQEGYIPIWSENGKVSAIKFQLPWSGVDDVLGGSFLINGLNPIFKTPLEMITGFDFFGKREISKSGNFGLGLGLSNIIETGNVINKMLFNDYAPTYEDKRLAGMLGKKLIDTLQVGKNLFSFADTAQEDGFVTAFSGLFPSVFSISNVNAIKYQNALIKRQRLKLALDYHKARARH